MSMEANENGMNTAGDEQEEVRSYLLGTLSEGVRTNAIEERIMTDDDYAELISVVEDDLIDDYLDGQLSSAERVRFVNHFLITEERKQKLRFIERVRKYAAENQSPARPEPKRPGFFTLLFASPVFRFAAVAVLFAGASFIFWRTFVYQSDIDKGLAELRRAYKGQRPIESRTTLSPDYAPLIVTRGGERTASDQKAVDRARLILLASDESDSRTRNALGVLYLNNGELDKALAELSKAVEVSPGNAGFYSDLSAAYLEKAKRSDSSERPDKTLEELSLALKASDSALKIEPARLEALFNRALILQRMRVGSQARDAWNKYIEMDPGSRWAEEAQRNLERIMQEDAPAKEASQILHDFLDAFQRADDDRAWEIASQTKELVTGVMIQRQLSRRFLDAKFNQDDNAAVQILAALSYLGNVEMLRSGDLFFSELAAFYEGIESSQAGELLSAQRQLDEGHRLILGTEFSKAIESLKKAKAIFQRQDDIWEAKITDYQISYSYSRLNRFTESNEILLELSSFAATRNFSWLQGIADAWIGSNFLFEGEHSRVVFYEMRALGISERISDAYNIQKINNQLSNQFCLLNQKIECLGYAYRAMTSVQTYYAPPRQHFRNLNFITEALFSQRLYGSAAVYGEEQLVFSSNVLRDAWMTYSSHKNLGLIYAELDDPRRSAEHFSSAFDATNRFDDPEMRANTTSETANAFADTLREQSRCPEAITNYDRALSIYESTGFVFDRFQAQKGRLLCNIAAGNDSAIRDELPKLIAVYEQNRQSILDEESRNIFFSNEQSVYDIAVRYAYGQHEPETAFNYAENSRSRSLLRKVAPARSRPVGLSELIANVPADVQVLYYAVMADRILIWTITIDGYETAESVVSLGALNLLISEYLELMTADPESDLLRDRAEVLYRYLVAPVRDRLNPGKSLCIVPDKQLSRVPFASLSASPSENFLVEDFAMFSSPSATLLLEMSSLAEKRAQARDDVLFSIGNPRFSRSSYPELPDLPSAASEARKIAENYRDSLVLVDEQVTKGRFENSLDSSDVVHFAGHYVLNATMPSRSRLLLASDEITVEEIASMKIGRVKLLILSACETGAGRLFDGEGVVGATRAFLAAGTPLVVASQWKVDSEGTAAMMVLFHRFRRSKKMPVAQALRSAQIEMIKNENKAFRHPFYWAGFMPVGGYTKY